jgi:hypothetical protein
MVQIGPKTRRQAPPLSRAPTRAGTAQPHPSASSFLQGQARIWSNAGQVWRSQVGVLALQICRLLARDLAKANAQIQPGMTKEASDAAALWLLNGEFGFSQHECAGIAGLSRSTVRYLIQVGDDFIERAPADDVARIQGFIAALWITFDGIEAAQAQTAGGAEDE